jgi:hypothetical protein
LIFRWKRPGFRQSDPAGKKQFFRYPLPGARRTALPRIALLDTDFEPGPNVARFAGDEIPRMRVWEPEVLVVPLSLALTLADQKQRGLLDLPSLSTAIIALTSVEDSPIVDHHRDLLWRAFGVPLFEQLRGTKGGVIAVECEVHDGLHLLDVDVPVAGELITDQCPCGAEMPRVRRAAPVKVGAAAAAK